MACFPIYLSVRVKQFLQAAPLLSDAHLSSSLSYSNKLVNPGVYRDQTSNMAYEDITKQLSTTTDEIHTADIDVEKRAAMYGAPASENLAFTKACFAFRDGLDSKRRGTGDIKETVVAAVEEVDNLEPPVPLSETLRQEKRERQIRILRAVHHTLTAILSLVVAVFQGMTCKHAQLHCSSYRG